MSVNSKFNISAGDKFKLNNGETATVLECNGWDDVLIRMKRGNTKTVQKSNLIKGSVIDPMRPSLCGVGFIGVGEFSSKMPCGKHTPEYSHWHDMICRCYNEKRLNKFPTYIGCTVCVDWLNFQNFAKWFNDNYIDGLELDKDIKIKGNKVYSPTSCKFATRAENNEAATAKRFTFTSPSGDRVELFNLSEFCRLNKLSVSCMSLVHSGKRKRHKGWKI